MKKITPAHNVVEENSQPLMRCVMTVKEGMKVKNNR